jgi:hypothetical protein
METGSWPRLRVSRASCPEGGGRRAKVEAATAAVWHLPLPSLGLQVAVWIFCLFWSCVCCVDWDLEPKSHTVQANDWRPTTWLLHAAPPDAPHASPHLSENCLMLFSTLMGPSDQGISSGRSTWDPASDSPPPLSALWLLRGLRNTTKTFCGGGSALFAPARRTKKKTLLRGVPKNITAAAKPLLA